MSGHEKLKESDFLTCVCSTVHYSLEQKYSLQSFMISAIARTWKEFFSLDKNGVACMQQCIQVEKCTISKGEVRTYMASVGGGDFSQNFFPALERPSFSMALRTRIEFSALLFLQQFYPHTLFPLK